MIDYAVRITAVCDALPGTPGKTCPRPAAAQRHVAESPADFIHKIKLRLDQLFTIPAAQTGKPVSFAAFIGTDFDRTPSESKAPRCK